MQLNAKGGSHAFLIFGILARSLCDFGQFSFGVKLIFFVITVESLLYELNENQDGLGKKLIYL